MSAIWGDGGDSSFAGSQAGGGADADGSADHGVSLVAFPGGPACRLASNTRRLGRMPAWQSGRPTCAAQPGPSLGMGLNLEPSPVGSALAGKGQRVVGGVGAGGRQPAAGPRLPGPEPPRNGGSAPFLLVGLTKTGDVTAGNPLRGLSCWHDGCARVLHAWTILVVTCMCESHACRAGTWRGPARGLDNHASMQPHMHACVPTHIHAQYNATNSIQTCHHPCRLRTALRHTHHSTSYFFRNTESCPSSTQPHRTQNGNRAVLGYMFISKDHRLTRAQSTKHKG
eukprot:363978-Chlamydomonas_euryale.AAC.8